MKNIMLISACILLASCHSKNNPLGSDEFVPVVHGDELYVINNRTGEAFQLEDGERFDITPYDPDVKMRLDELSEHTIRFDAEVGSPAVLTVKGISKAIAEEPKVLVAVVPYVKPVRDLTGTVFWLQFLDSDGFQIAREGISASDLTSNVDGQGGYLGFSAQKDLGMSREQYGYVASVDVIWTKQLDDALTSWLETDAGKRWQQSERSSATNQEGTSND